jgi:energy-coupling factor transporter ATP-binding protein EcfA2
LNQQGTTIVLITHDAKLICRYAPRVIVLESGRVVADGPPRRPVALPGTRASDRKDPHLTSSEEESV